MPSALLKTRASCFLLCVTLASSTPAPSIAQGTSGEESPTLDRARESIKTGDYDNAIETLRKAIESPAPIEDQRAAYLLLIKTYVIVGNDNLYRPQGRETSRLNYEKAKEIIAECLQKKDLRHTRAEPAAEYPDEMHRFFEEVRAQIFGAFRVVKLDPPHAVVLLDGDTLRRQPTDGQLGDVNLAVGPHHVKVSAPGYKELSDEIRVSPNSTVERAFQLTKPSRRGWYAVGALVLAGVVAGVVAGSDDDGSNPPQTLLGPPPPP